MEDSDDLHCLCFRDGFLPEERRHHQKHGRLQADGRSIPPGRRRTLQPVQQLPERDQSQRRLQRDHETLDHRRRCQCDHAGHQDAEFGHAAPHRNHGQRFSRTFIKDGKWAGFETEMLYRFAQYINRPVELYDYDFGALIAALNTNKVDAIFSTMCVTEERARSVKFSAPYYLTRTIVIKRSADAPTQPQLSFGEQLKVSFHRNLIEEDRWKLIVDGLGETLYISVFAILLGIVVGAMVCALRMSRRKLLRGIAIAYVEIMRGVPILVFLMIMFYIVFATSRVTATWVAIFAFTLNFGAYVSEMFRTGIEGVDKGQIEAGRAMGFIRSRTFDAFFPLIVITIIYFLLAWLLGLLLEKLANRSPRRSR